MEVKSGYCKQCGENTVLIANGPKHTLHLVLTILTAGLWVIIWILVSIAPKSWMCQTCGSTRVVTRRQSKIHGDWADYKQKKREAKAAKRTPPIAPPTSQP